MKLTAVQRRLLSEDGVLDYKGPGATKATPDAVPHGAFKGTSEKPSDKYMSLLDRIEELLKKRVQSKKQNSAGI